MGRVPRLHHFYFLRRTIREGVVFTVRAEEEGVVFTVRRRMRYGAVVRMDKYRYVGTY